MTQFEKDVIDRLARIESNIESLQGKLNNDFRALHGNGKPGLLDRVTALETNQKAQSKNTGMIAGIIAWIVNAAIAVYAALKNQ